MHHGAPPSRGMESWPSGPRQRLAKPSRRKSLASSNLALSATSSWWNGIHSNLNSCRLRASGVETRWGHNACLAEWQTRQPEMLVSHKGRPGSSPGAGTRPHGASNRARRGSSVGRARDSCSRQSEVQVLSPSPGRAWDTRGYRDRLLRMPFGLRCRAQYSEDLFRGVQPSAKASTAGRARVHLRAVRRTVQHDQPRNAEVLQPVVFGAGDEEPSRDR